MVGSEHISSIVHVSVLEFNASPAFDCDASPNITLSAQLLAWHAPRDQCAVLDANVAFMTRLPCALRCVRMTLSVASVPVATPTTG